MDVFTGYFAQIKQYRYKSGQTNATEYETEFMQYLRSIDVKSIVEKVAKNRDIILCCYEKPGDFCHRHLVAQVLNENGLDVVEFQA